MRAPAASRDPETRLTGDHHASLRLWLRLYTCTRLVETAMRRRLRSGFGVSLARFDLMAQLERSPGGLSMTELSGRLLVTGGNVTGLVAQLVRARLVTRTPDPRDRRSARVRLTAAGRHRFAEWAADHQRWIAELLEGLGTERQLALAEALAELKQHVRDREEGHRDGPHRAPRHLRAR